MVAFQLPAGMPATRRVRFQQKFWGRTTKTHGGKYQHHEAGLMERVAHRRLVKGVFLLRLADLEPVTEFLREWKAIHHVRRVQLHLGDEDALDRSTE